MIDYSSIRLVMRDILVFINISFEFVGNIIYTLLANVAINNINNDLIPITTVPTKPSIQVASSICLIATVIFKDLIYTC
ncbi:MAG: hypothetical protein ACRD5J_17275, partial [Nitrososphaeraceae archaeon]